MLRFLPDFNIKIETAFFDEDVEVETHLSKPVTLIHRETGVETEFLSRKAAANFFGVTHQAISLAIKLGSLVFSPSPVLIMYGNNQIIFTLYR